MAMAAIESLIRRSQPVERRLQALARGLDGARNPVAARRHFARVLDALEGDAVAHAITGPQVSVLCFARLRAGWLPPQPAAAPPADTATATTPATPGPARAGLGTSSCSGPRAWAKAPRPN